MNTPGVLRSVPTGKGGGPDHDILAGCRDGDRGAWRTLYDRYSPIVHRFLATFGVPPEEREDACQEVFVAVYRSLTHFRGEARLSTWIYRIAARHASRSARRRRVRTMLSSMLLREPPPPPAPDASEKTERLRMLDELIAKLSPKKKLVLVLFEIEGLPIEEVAQIAECPENTAWSRLHYARAELMAMARKRLKTTKKDDRETGRAAREPPRWPDGDDAIAAELRRALDEAQQRIPDDVTLRRGWAAIDTDPRSGGARRGCRGSRAAWRAPPRSALACAAWLWPRVVQTPERGQDKQAAVARTRVDIVGDATADARRRRRGGAAGHQRDAHRRQRPARRGRHRPVQGASPAPGTSVRRARRPYHVVVVGTKFGVAVNGDRRVDVDVDEGVVEVWNNDVRLARLEPGQRWNSSPESDDATATGAQKPAAKLGDAADKSTEKFELPVMPPEKAPPSPGLETTLQLRSETHHRRSSVHGGRQVAMVGTRRVSPPPRRRPRRAPRWRRAMRRARWRSARRSRRSPVRSARTLRTRSVGS